MKQQEHDVEGINDAIRFYICTKMAADAAFPFDPGDPFRAIVVDGVVLIAPPDDVPGQIEIPSTYQTRDS